METNYSKLSFKEKDLIEELENDVKDWKAIHAFDMGNYLCSSNEEINARNNRIRSLSQEIYAYYFNLRDEIKYYLDNICEDIDEYFKLIEESKKEDE